MTWVNPEPRNTMQAILMYGTIEDGYRFIGPFISKQEIDIYLDDPRFSYLRENGVEIIWLQDKESQA